MSSRSQHQKQIAQSYRPKGYGMSPGLLRARQVYRLPNVLTGLGLGVFVTGVWAYSISAVKQENFDDIDEEARRLAMKGTLATSRSPDSSYGGEVDRELHANQQPSGLSIAAAHGDRAATEAILAGSRRGLLPSLLASRLLDPTSLTLVWGAPSVDQPGSWQERSSFGS